MTESPKSLEELLDRHAQVAVELSRADQTAWNGQIVALGEGLLGVAHWDGTMYLDREEVLDPLRELYSKAGTKQSADQLGRYRDALATLLHEQSHFLGPAGASGEAARAAFRAFGSRALEEGVAEAWSCDRLDDYIARLGIDQVAPGITKAKREASYPAFVPAVRLLAEDLGRRATASPVEVLEALNRRTAEGQWQLVVDLVYESTCLPVVVPPDREPAVRLRLENTLRTSFDELTGLERLPRGFAAARSKSIGSELVARLDDELGAAERFFDKPYSGSRRDTSRRSAEAAARQALSGIASPLSEPRGQREGSDSGSRSAGCSSREVKTRRSGELLTGS